MKPLPTPNIGGEVEGGKWCWSGKAIIVTMMVVVTVPILIAMLQLIVSADILLGLKMVLFICSCHASLPYNSFFFLYHVICKGSFLYFLFPPFFITL